MSITKLPRGLQALVLAPLLALPVLSQTPDWRRVDTVGAQPRGLLGGAVAYDAVRSVTVSFGGQDPNGGFLDETWVFDGQDWREVVTTTRPSARSEHVLAFDFARSAVVLFGGTDPAGDALGDTWVFDGIDWRELTPVAPPPARRDSALVYDFVDDRLLLFGGRGDGTSLLGDAWAFDGTAWTSVGNGGPDPRRGHVLATSFDGRPLLFGGSGSTGDLGDTWRWTGTDWVAVAGGSGPAARSGAVAVGELLSGQLILFGGVSSIQVAPGLTQAILRDDTWIYDGNGWREVRPATVPPANFGAAATYDLGRSTLVRLGGFSGTFTTGGLWEFGGGAAGSARFESFGTGCFLPGRSATLGAAANSLPRLGTTLRTLVRGPGTSATLLAGFSDQNLGGLSLPLDLTPFGLLSCQLLIDPLASVSLPIPAGGAASFDLPVPNDGALVGQRIFLQAVVPTAPGPLGDLVLSNGARLVIGR